MDRSLGYCCEGSSPCQLERSLTPTAVPQRGCALYGVNVDLVWPPCASTEAETSVQIVVSLQVRQQAEASDDDSRAPATFGQEWRRELAAMVVSTTGALLAEKTVVVDRGNTCHWLTLPELAKPTVVYVALNDPDIHMPQVPEQCTAPILLLPPAPLQEAQRLFARAAAALMHPTPRELDGCTESAALTALLQNNQPVAALTPSQHAAACIAWAEYYRPFIFDLATVLTPAPVPSNDDAHQLDHFTAAVIQPSDDNGTVDALSTSDAIIAAALSSNEMTTMTAVPPSVDIDHLDVYAASAVATPSPNSSTRCAVLSANADENQFNSVPVAAIADDDAVTDQHVSLASADCSETCSTTSTFHAALNQLLQFLFLNEAWELLSLILTAAQTRHGLHIMLGDVAVTASSLTGDVLRQLPVPSVTTWNTLVTMQIRDHDGSIDSGSTLQPICTAPGSTHFGQGSGTSRSPMHTNGYDSFNGCATDSAGNSGYGMVQSDDTTLAPTGVTNTDLPLPRTPIAGFGSIASIFRQGVAGCEDAEVRLMLKLLLMAEVALILVAMLVPMK